MNVRCVDLVTVFGTLGESGELHPEHRHLCHVATLIVTGGFREVSAQGERIVLPGEVLWVPETTAHCHRALAHSAMIGVAWKGEAPPHKATGCLTKRILVLASIIAGRHSSLFGRIGLDTIFNADEFAPAAGLKRLVQSGSTPTVDAWARASDLNRSHLSRIVRGRWGASARDTLTIIKLAGAIDAALFKAEPLGNAAALADFHDQAHFNHAARRWLSATPTEIVRTFADGVHWQH